MIDNEQVIIKISRDDFNKLVTIPKVREIIERSVVSGFENIGGTYKKELLTIERMQRLFGQNYNGLIYYNFDTGAWNTDRYRGYTINKQREHTELANEFKAVLERCPEFADYELVAMVVMAIRGRLYPGFSCSIHFPMYNAFANGDAAVGTIVRRDRKTGRILPVPNNWLGVSEFDEEAVAKRSAKNFASFGVASPEFRKQLLSIHGKQK